MKADSRTPGAVPERYLDAAAQPDAESRIRERLPAKLKKLADNRLVGLAKESYGYVTHPAVSRKTKLMGAGALLYLIAPFDAVADVIPGLGYVDDAAVLTAFVLSARDAAKEVVDHTRHAAAEVVAESISEAREAWARRGVSQVCLSLWAATGAACIGLLYFGVRQSLSGDALGAPLEDPFFWACMLAGVLGLAYQGVFAWQVFSRYQSARPELKEPLAWAIVSLADWRQVVLLSLPVFALAAVMGARALLD